MAPETIALIDKPTLLIGVFVAGETTPSELKQLVEKLVDQPEAHPHQGRGAGGQPVVPQV
jgi:hypothetical protein